MKDTQKLFIIKKYVMAKSASDAIKKDPQVQIDDVWVDEDWKKENINKGNIGY